MPKKNIYTKIYSEKPDIFGHFPDTLLDLDTIEHLREIPCVAVAEIHNTGTLTAMVELLSKRKPDAFVPTISYTGTEYGDLKKLLQHLKLIKNIVEKDLRIYCAEPVLMGSPQFWWALNGRFRSELSSRFGYISTCAGCRLYSFALRVPLCKKIGAKIIIPADIGAVSSCTDFFVSPPAIMYYIRIMASFGIELCYSQKNFLDEPNRETHNGHDGGRLFRCTLQGNHLNEEGIEEKSPGLQKYFEVFAVPAVAKILSRVLCGAEVDYENQVVETFMPVEKKVNKKKPRR